MAEPRRIQRKRVKGWRLPEGAKCVTRPGPWGNPFTLEWVRLGNYAGIPGEDLTDYAARVLAVSTFATWLTDDAYAAPFPNSLHKRREWMLTNLPKLAGLDLACWCPLPKDGEPDYCHAAVLLDLVRVGIGTDRQLGDIQVVLERTRRGGR